MAETHDPSDPRSAEYLEAQIRLAKLQADNIELRKAIELTNLKWDNIHGRIRVLVEALALGVALLFFGGGVTLVIAAARDHALVVDSFSVPPDFAQSGQSGTVIATHLLDRIATMQDAAPSMRAADSYQNDWGNDFRVQIPQTGISVSDAYRFIVAHIGHRTLITGEIVRVGTALELTVRVQGNSAQRFFGPDLDKLVNEAAEHVLEVTQPYRYGIFLTNRQNRALSDKVLWALALGNAAPTERAWAYSGLSFNALTSGDLENASTYAQEAIKLDNTVVPAHSNLEAVELRHGQDEAALEQEQLQVRILRAGGNIEMTSATTKGYYFTVSGYLASELGDFRSAADFQRQAADVFAGDDPRHGRALLAAAIALSRGHNAVEAQQILARTFLSMKSIPEFPQEVSDTTAEIRGYVSEEHGNWKEAAADFDRGVSNRSIRHPFVLTMRSLFAIARGRSGDFAAASAAIDATPDDCYSCARARGDVRASRGIWNAAAFWFQRAVQLAPSIPFAYADWGAMLLQKGDYDGAIAKFALANQKGPHFADPLEMWGEALMAKNRSDLALAKFAEADKYAPNWGRLHLKWGEALFYAGQKDDAKTQFAAAAARDLTPSEKSELAHVRRADG